MESLFKGLYPIDEKLEAFGFERENKEFIKTFNILNHRFLAIFKIKQDSTPLESQISIEVIDKETKEEYVLHNVSGAKGAFAASIKEEIERIAKEVATCFEKRVFQSIQAREIIAYVREKYQDELEFLWQKFPNNAIWRRSDNKKWYGALLSIPFSKLGVKSSEIVEIIDLRFPADKIQAQIQKNGYYPAWHMNKNHWITLVLNGSIPIKTIFTHLDESYHIAKKK